MANYYTTHQTAAGTNLTIILLGSAAAARAAVSHLILGSDATPANLAGEFIVARTTAAGSGGSALNEEPSDPASGTAAVTATGGTFTTEPTYGNNLLMIPLNQQATFQWWANPGFELKAATGTANGLGLRSVAHGGTPNMNATLAWSEARPSNPFNEASTRHSRSGVFCMAHGCERVSNVLARRA